MNRLTLELLEKFTSANAPATLSTLSELYEDLYGTSADPAILLNMFHEIDDIVKYHESLSSTPKNDSNLFRRLSEYLQSLNSEDLLLVMTNYNPNLADNWYKTQPALRTIKTIRIFSEITLHNNIALFEAIVYGQGGKIEDQVKTQSSAVDAAPIQELTDENLMKALQGSVF